MVGTAGVSCMTFFLGPAIRCAAVAKGMPIGKNRVFLGKQGHAITGTDHGVQSGGPVVDHGELDMLAGNADRFQKPGEWLPVPNGPYLLTAQGRSGCGLK